MSLSWHAIVDVLQYYSYPFRVTDSSRTWRFSDAPIYFLIVSAALTQSAFAIQRDCRKVTVDTIAFAALDVPTALRPSPIDLALSVRVLLANPRNVRAQRLVSKAVFENEGAMTTLSQVLAQSFPIQKELEMFLTFNDIPFGPHIRWGTIPQSIAEIFRILRENPDEFPGLIRALARDPKTYSLIAQWFNETVSSLRIQLTDFDFLSTPGDRLLSRHRLWPTDSVVEILPEVVSPTASSGRELVAQILATPANISVSQSIARAAMGQSAVMEEMGRIMVGIYPDASRLERFFWNNALPFRPHIRWGSSWENIREALRILRENPDEFPGLIRALARDAPTNPRIAHWFRDHVAGVSGGSIPTGRAPERLLNRLRLWRYEAPIQLPDTTQDVRSILEVVAALRLHPGDALSAQSLARWILVRPEAMESFGNVLLNNFDKENLTILFTDLAIPSALLENQSQFQMIQNCFDWIREDPSRLAPFLSFAIRRDESGRFSRWFQTFSFVRPRE